MIIWIYWMPKITCSLVTGSDIPPDVVGMAAETLSCPEIGWTWEWEETQKWKPRRDDVHVDGNVAENKCLQQTERESNQEQMRSTRMEMTRNCE